MLAKTDIHAENPAASDRAAMPPCAVRIVEEPWDRRPDYMNTNNPTTMDFPFSPVRIGEDFWVIYRNGYIPAVVRFKGSTIEDAVRQPNGTADVPLRAPYMLGGMWYDPEGKKLYSPMHCEQAGYNGNVLREIHLASSTNLGLTWQYEGPLVTRDAPDRRREGTDFSGLYWDGGDGDLMLYVDARGGYFYLFSNHYTWPKTGIGARTFGRHHVARCALADKMAPGKWKKFYNGTWEEPGIGGKASFVNGCCVSYNHYLRRYVSIDYSGGMAFCTDLAKQDWTPNFRMGDTWGINGSYGFWMTDDKRNDIYESGQTLYVYNFWCSNPGTKFKVTFDTNAPPVWTPMNTSTFNPGGSTMAASTDPGHGYPFVPLFESGDPIEARRARRVGCDSPENRYAGSWKAMRHGAYYEQKAKVSEEKGAEVAFTFQGREIYWRAAKGPDMGKADVILDGVPQGTVDCWASMLTAHPIAFIRTGLDESRPHTIQIVVRNEKNERSSGTAIHHMLFEHGADTYRASDGYSGIQGKNQWRYRQREKGTDADLAFTNPAWRGTGRVSIDYFRVIPDKQDAVREWTAPHDGTVRVEGDASLEGGLSKCAVSLRKGQDALWTAQLNAADKRSASHDTNVVVRKGDALSFVAGLEGSAAEAIPPGKENGDATSASAAKEGSVFWDPVITYTDAH